MNKYFSLDIETNALPTAQLTELMPTFEADKRLKDPEKIAADIAGQQGAFIEKAALNATTGIILCIGLGIGDDKPSIFEGDEGSMLGAFWREFEPSCNYIGHNLLGFDLPFMIRRSWIVGAKLPNLFSGRYLDSCFQDTMTTWGCGVYGEKISLSNLSKALGVGETYGSGKDFGKLYQSGPEGREEALKHLRQDLLLTYKCAEKMGMFR